MVEFPRLAQDFNGYGDLPNIVEQTSDSDAFQAVQGKIHFSGYGDGQLRHPFLVTRSLGVSHLHGCGHGINDAMETALYPAEQRF